ncbi:site-specific DNA-methyltransferase [bacterium]|nr:MAG: site-specific DNA-methyltransferase [bacterium]
MKPELNKIYEGDCIEIMRQWDDDCIDHCITDPPYNMSKRKGLGWAFSNHITMEEKWDVFSREDYLDFTREWLNEVCRVVKPNGNIFIFGSFHNIYDIGFIINEKDLKIINSIVWFKPNAQPNITCRMLTESTEYIIWACNATKAKAKGWTFNYDISKELNTNKQMRNVWEIPYPSQKERTYGKHPSQKPIDLIRRIILIATNKSDSILDCFSGSGTTGVVAQGLKRDWVMIDNNPEYNKIAKNRLKNVQVTLPKSLVQTTLKI